ncbi:MAG: trigger factor [Clostridia bacterium]|nr:trigger factor [Clostridia bacterium]
MSLKEKKLLEKNKYLLTISVDKETFDTAVTKVFKKQSKNITIPGFRRGKAPRAIIEKMYGKGVFHEDAVNEVLPDAYEEAAKESGLEIVGRPKFDIDTIDENGVIITAEVFVKPEVKIEGYKGIEAEKAPVCVDDSEIDAEIDKVRERNARITDIEDRAAQDGDIANIDFEGSVDGKVFDGGTAKGHEITLGSHQFIDGFEEQIVGKNIGDEFDVNVTFPADYHAEELAGKPAVFKVKLNSLKVKELPDADDELATMASEFDTLADYKADIKAKILERKNQAEDRKIEGQLIDALIDKIDADIPECMYDDEAENLLRDMDNNLRMQGLDLSTYLKYTGMDLQTVRAEMRPRAINQVKTRLALEAIAALEGIEATEDDVNEEIEKISKAYGVSVDEVKKMIPDDGVKEDIKVRKAVEFVKDNAKITEKAAETDKPKAKKAPTKKSAAKAGDEKAASTKAETKKAPAKKPAAKKSAAETKEEKTDGEKAAKKPAAKKAPAKKTPAKKAPAKKADDAEA